MNTIDHIVAYVFFLFSLGYLILIIRKHKDDIWNAYIGSDGKLSLPEFMGFLWTILFCILFFSELFLGKTAGSHIWYSMDSIFLIIIGGNAIKRNEKSDSDNG